MFSVRIFPFSVLGRRTDGEGWRVLRPAEGSPGKRLLRAVVAGFWSAAYYRPASWICLSSAVLLACADRVPAASSCEAEELELERVQHIRLDEMPPRSAAVSDDGVVFVPQGRDEVVQISDANLDRTSVGLPGIKGVAASADRIFAHTSGEVYSVRFEPLELRLVELIPSVTPPIRQVSVAEGVLWIVSGDDERATVGLYRWATEDGLGQTYRWELAGRWRIAAMGNGALLVGIRRPFRTVWLVPGEPARLGSNLISLSERNALARAAAYVTGLIPIGRGIAIVSIADARSADRWFVRYDTEHDQIVGTTAMDSPMSFAFSSRNKKRIYAVIAGPGGTIVVEYRLISHLPREEKGQEHETRMLGSFSRRCGWPGAPTDS